MRADSILSQRKVQVKTTVSYPLYPLKCLCSKISVTPNVGEDVEKLGLSYTVRGNVKRWQFFK